MQQIPPDEKFFKAIPRQLSSVRLASAADFDVKGLQRFVGEKRVYYRGRLLSAAALLPLTSTVGFLIPLPVCRGGVHAH